MNWKMTPFERARVADILCENFQLIMSTKYVVDATNGILDHVVREIEKSECRDWDCSHVWKALGIVMCATFNHTNK